jgi:peroxiredoxin
MKTRIALLLLSAAGLAAAEPNAAPSNDWDALNAMQKARPPWGPEENVGVSKSMLWMDAHNRETGEAALKYFENHPGDPHRWDAALIAIKSSIGFVTSIAPGADEAFKAKDLAKFQSMITRDTAARDAWDRRVEDLEKALEAASDVDPETLSDALSWKVYQEDLKLGTDVRRRMNGMAADIATIEKRDPQSKHLVFAYERYLPWLQRQSPGQYQAKLQELSQSSNADVLSMAVGHLNIAAAKDKAMDLRFTALDGREVDLSKLRGRVVLVDFWATWCGPCKEELPNVRANYEKYHDKGFDVIGISLDSAQDRRKLADFCKDNDLPWPQYFDGKGWKNDVAVKYSIHGIPAMFLLDQNGLVVSTDARGEKLEPAIRKLLGL